MSEKTVDCSVKDLRCRYEHKLNCQCPVVDEPDDYHVTVTWTPVGATLEVYTLRATIDEYQGAERTQERIARSIYDEFAVAGIADLRVSLRNRRHDYEVVVE